MKARRIALVCGAILLAVASLEAEIVRRVRSAEELLRAIGPDRTIIVAAGTHRIRTARVTETDYVSLEPVTGGSEIVISGVWDLTIHGEEGAQILAESPDAWVLTLRDSTSVTLVSLALGHAQPSECGAGVLKLEGCEEVQVLQCELFGSGTVGLEVQGSHDVTVADTKIRGCTLGAVHALQSAYLTLERSSIWDNAAYPLFQLSACQAVSIQDTAIFENEGESFVAIDGEPEQLEISDCDVYRNIMESFATGGARPVLREVRWLANQFGDVGASPEGEGAAEEWAFYSHESSGLGFSYPGAWELESGPEGFVGVADRGETVALIFVPLYELSADDDMERDPAGVMARALTQLTSQADESDAFVVRETEPVVGPKEGLPSQVLRGTMKIEGEPCAFILRLIAARRQVYAALAIFRGVRAEQLHAESVRTILQSFGRVGGDE